jgi:16S rRNA (guanine527-N7)-methyltransferase
MDPFAAKSSPALEAAIGERAKACGIELDTSAVEALALHARRVREQSASLHLTSINDPVEFLERHPGESLEGAALLDPAVEGVMVDLGSGNGYPGLPVAAARPGLVPVLIEAAKRKAAFLQEVVEAAFPGGRVLERQVQRASDLEDLGPVRVVVTRAAGDWDRVLPRLSSSLTPDGTLLVWAGAHMEAVHKRRAWSRYRLAEQRSLPGRDRSWIWRFERA